MEEETKWIKSILPDDYICEPRTDGVHCYSFKGINDGELWEYFYKAVKQKYGDRFMEIYHQTYTNNLRFTVFLRK